MKLGGNLGQLSLSGELRKLAVRAQAEIGD